MRLGRRKKPFVVLGCGPAGLFAAHALEQAGEEFEIHSKKRRSEMFGAQYLHKPIPRLSPDFDSPWPIEYMLRGDAEGYRDKVYGPNSTVKVSPETLLGKHDAWDIRAAYYAAWDRFSERVRNLPEIDPTYVSELQNQHRVVSSIPANYLCRDRNHRFDIQEIWTVGDAPERGVFCPIVVEPWSVVCDGTRNVGWYRAANVFNYRTAEWPGELRPPIDGVVKVIKPIGTNCDCFPGVLRVGRYGTWDKNKLSHEAYSDIWKVL